MSTAQAAWPDGVPGTRLPKLIPQFTPKLGHAQVAEKQSRPFARSPDLGTSALGFPAGWGVGVTTAEACQRLWEGDARYLHGDADGALQSYRAAIAAAPAWAPPRCRRALTLSLLGRKKQAADAALQDRHALPLGPIPTLELLACCKDTDPYAALALVGKAVSGSGDTELALYYGDCLLAVHQTDRARRVWNTALRSAYLPMLKGDLLKRLADLEPDTRVDARIRLLQAAVREDDEPDTRLELGYALFAQQRFPEALEQMRAYVQDEPRSGDQELLAADCCYRMGRWREALSWLELAKANGVSGSQRRRAARLRSRLAGRRRAMESLLILAPWTLAIGMLAAASILERRRK
jgi:tetratricopeptide (TPR) repeat protein